MTDRYFANDLQPVSADNPDVLREISAAAGKALKEVKASALAHRDVSGGGVYVGLGGVAMTYLRMAQQVQRGFKYGHSSYLKKHSMSHSLNLAAALLAEADKLMSSKRVTFLEGASGLLALQASLAHLQGDTDSCNLQLKAVEALWERHISGVLPDSECELLYGRAGYLYSLCWLQQQLGEQAVPRQLLKAVVRHILDEGIREAGLRQQQPLGGSSSSSAAWQLMYSWHNKRYLGAAHGLAGILYMLLHCMPLVRELDREQAAAAGGGGGGGGVGGSYYAAVRASVQALAGAALPSGNLPTKLGDQEDVRVAWCHGAAGLLLTMIKAADVLGDDDGRFMAAATAAAQDIWRRGLLKKGVGLCHGISGNGYALLALARATGDEQWLSAAQQFGLYAARHWQQLQDIPDRPASLYEGLAGAVCFWLDLLEHGSSNKWPGAEL